MTILAHHHMQGSSMSSFDPHRNDIEKAVYAAVGALFKGGSSVGTMTTINGNVIINATATTSSSCLLGGSIVVTSCVIISGVVIIGITYYYRYEIISFICNIWPWGKTVIKPVPSPEQQTHENLQQLQTQFPFQSQQETKPVEPTTLPTTDQEQHKDNQHQIEPKQNKVEPHLTTKDIDKQVEKNTETQNIGLIVFKLLKENKK
jgi:NDP-sugar pyrophosphorylase family protein